MEIILTRTGELVGENSDWEIFIYLFKQETKIDVWLKYLAKINFIYSITDNFT